MNQPTPSTPAPSATPAHSATSASSETPTHSGTPTNPEALSASVSLSDSADTAAAATPAAPSSARPSRATPKIGDIARQQYRAFISSGVAADCTLSPYEAAAAYAALTGACLEGCLAFTDRLLSDRAIPFNQGLTLPEIAGIAGDQQGADIFAEALNRTGNMLAPYRSDWDLEIKSPTERSGLQESGIFKVLQLSSSARFTDCRFSTLRYQINTNTWTTLSRCSGSTLDLTVGSCAEVNVEQALFYSKANITVTTGRDVDIAVETERLNILVSSCSWFQFTLDNYRNSSGPYLREIDIHVATANSGHEHSLRLPLTGFNNEKLLYQLTGDRPTITGSLNDHIIDSYQSGCVKLNVQLGAGAPLELKAR